MLRNKNLELLKAAGRIDLNVKLKATQLRYVFNLTMFESVVFEELMKRELITFAQFLHGWVDNFRFDGVYSSKIDEHVSLAEEQRGVRDIKASFGKVIIVVPSRDGSRMITIDEDDVTVAVFNNSTVTIETASLLTTEVDAGFFGIDFINPAIFEHTLHSFCDDEDLVKFYASSLHDEDSFYTLVRTATKWKVTNMSQRVIDGTYMTFDEKVKRSWNCKRHQTFNYNLCYDGKRVTKNVDGVPVLDSFYNKDLLTEHLSHRDHTFYCRDTFADLNLITGGAKTTCDTSGKSSVPSKYDVGYDFGHDMRIDCISFTYTNAAACKKFILV